MNIILLTLVFIILIGNIIFLIHHSGLYPFIRDRSRPREAFFLPSPQLQDEKMITHGYYVLTGWNDLIRKQIRKKLSDSKDPIPALEMALGQFLEDPSEKNFDIMVHLSNHISNRVRYDDEVNAVIEKISELSLDNPIKD